jgi:hypothetical protein
MKDRINVEIDEDGDISIILRPRPREKGDVEARAIRDAIDYLAELLINQGAMRVAEILLGITEQEDISDPVSHAIIMHDEVPVARYYGTEPAQPMEWAEPVWRQAVIEQGAARPVELTTAAGTLAAMTTTRPGRRR